MATLHPNIRAFWSGTSAALISEAGWSRDTDDTTGYDGRYLQGDDATFTGPANVTRANHTHTAFSHTHVGNAHAHRTSARRATGSVSVEVKSGGSPVFVRFQGPAPGFAEHTHAFNNSTTAVRVYNPVGVTTGNSSADPPFVELIVMRPDNGDQELPPGSVFFMDASPTGNFHITDGAGGTADWDGLFVRGAAGDAGGTGGAETHDHTQSHRHTYGNHAHGTSAPSGNAVPSVAAGIDTVISVPRLSHHFISLSFVASASDTFDNTTNVDSENHLPSYRKLLGVQHVGVSQETPQGAILGWVGGIPVDGLPDDFIICDGNGGTVDCTDRQIRITKTVGEVGDGGGSDQHNHIFNHGHTDRSHTHLSPTISDAGSVGTDFASPGTIVLLNLNHAHVWIITAAVPGLQNANAIFQNVDGRQSYRTIVWIKKVEAEEEAGIVVLRRRIEGH